MSDTRPTFTPAENRPRQRHGAAWFALVAIAAAVVIYFLFFTGRPEDGTLTGTLPPTGSPAATVGGSTAPAPAAPAPATAN